jgi:hypothetical protein
MDSSTVLMVSGIGLALLSVVVLVSTGSILSLIIVLALVGMIGYILNQLGMFTFNVTNGVIDIAFHEKTPAPTAIKKNIVPSLPIEKKEVFYVSGNDYIYEEAAAVCAAYDGELASYDQVNEAYSAGAEWCGYGWTLGGMALFPTQQATWEALQTDPVNKTNCGRPGINGGYFDPQTKFGVNCYGVKPHNTGTKLPLPLPGSDPADFNKMVDKFKSMIKKMVVSPFNRDGWSEWNLNSHLPAASASVKSKK